MGSDEKEKSSEATANKGETAESEREGGLLPAILVGAGLLAVVALVLFGGDDDKDATTDKAAVAGKGEGGAVGGGGAVREGKGGVAAREADEATRVQTANPKINPAVRLPAGGMAPQGIPQKDDKPPEDATEEELIAWYEKKLEIAKRMLEQREKFKARLPTMRERIESSNHPDRDKQLEAFEGRKKIVEENYESAKKKVEEYEAVLAEMRGD